MVARAHMALLRTKHVFLPVALLLGGQGRDTARDGQHLAHVLSLHPQHSLQGDSANVPSASIRPQFSWKPAPGLVSPVLLLFCSLKTAFWVRNRVLSFFA